MIFPALTLGPIVEGLIALMLRRSQVLRHRGRRDHASSSASPIPALITGFAQVAFKSQANGSLITVNGKVVGSRARRAGLHEAAVLPRAPVGDLARLQRRRRRRSPTSARRTRSSRRTSQQARAGDPEARGAVQPGPDDPRHPGRRRHDLRLGDRPRHLAGLRAAAVAAHRGRPAPAARDRAEADLREHRRPQPRLLRRARRERPRAQPRPRQARRYVDGAPAAASIFSREIVARRDPRLVPEARPADAVQEPGDVHRRARQRDHDGDLLPRPRARARRPALVRRRRSRSGSG